jgi:hypothetical protein
MQADSEDMFIPCVASLGQNCFAVAHPIREGEPSNAIDIYDFPGTFKRTLADNIPPVYDMSSTPDGKLAVLSDGTGDTSCSVKLFDPETGYISSTRDIDIAKPMSLGVTLKHQYVILGENQEGQKQITVLDKDGVVEHEYVIDEVSNGFVGPLPALDVNDDELDVNDDENDSNDDELDVNDDENDVNDDAPVGPIPEGAVNDDAPAGPVGIVDKPKRIACGGRFIFVTGSKRVAVYEITDTGLQRIKTFSWGFIVIDISATIWDDVFTNENNSSDNDPTDSIFLDRIDSIQNKDNTWSWAEEKYQKVHENVTGADVESRVSTRDGRTVVMSHGQTIKVYKC